LCTHSGHFRFKTKSFTLRTGQRNIALEVCQDVSLLRRRRNNYWPLWTSQQFRRWMFGRPSKEQSTSLAPRHPLHPSLALITHEHFTPPTYAIITMADSETQGASYEVEHVHSVYEEIASHFSSTRYKVCVTYSTTNLHDSLT
jgi:hypothetical protein